MTATLPIILALTLQASGATLSIGQTEKHRITWRLHDDNGATMLTVTNADASGTVTAIGFEFDAIWTSGVEFVKSDKTNLPGANELGIAPRYIFQATTPTVKNGLTPGQSTTFEVRPVEGESFIIHVQSVGDDEHSLYTHATPIPAVPEPSSLMLLGVAGLTLVGRRTR